MYEIDKMPQMIDIGYTGEIEFRTVQIDMSAWVSQMPDATPTLMHIRPGETEPYPVEITYSSNIITWNVTDGDLGTKEGTGLLQVWFGVADEEQTMRQLGMSAVVATLVHLSIAGEGNNSATVQLPWLREVTGIKNLILGYDYEAESWANGKRGGEDVGEDDPAYHNNSKYYCEQVGATALDSEAYAIGTRAGEAVDEDDPAYHNNSKYYDEQAALEKAAAQAAAETASAAYNVNLLAPNYDATATYKVGDYVIYSGGYYRCISAITTAEAWTAAHWSQVTVGADVSSLKSALDANNASEGMATTYANGTISSATGQNSDSSTRCRSGYVHFTGIRMTVVAKSGYKVGIRIYSDNSGTYVKGEAFGTSYETYDNSKYYRFVVGKTDDSEIDKSSLPADVLTITQYFKTDKTLTDDGVPADAKATGKAVNTFDAFGTDIIGKEASTDTAYITSDGSLVTSENWKAHIFNITDIPALTHIESYDSSNTTYLQVAYYSSDTISSATFISGIPFQTGSAKNIIDRLLVAPDNAQVVVVTNRITSGNAVIEGIVNGMMQGIANDVDTLNKSVLLDGNTFDSISVENENGSLSGSVGSQISIGTQDYWKHIEIDAEAGEVYRVTYVTSTNTNPYVYLTDQSDIITERLAENTAGTSKTRTFVVTIPTGSKKLYVRSYTEKVKAEKQTKVSTVVKSLRDEDIEQRTELFKLSIKGKNKMLFSAHRGAEGQAPYGSYPAYKLACEQGWDMIQIASARQSYDGTWYCLHDETLYPQMNAEEGVKIKDTTDEDIAELYQIDGENVGEYSENELRLPTLESILQLAYRYGVKVSIRMGSLPDDISTPSNKDAWDSFIALCGKYSPEFMMFSGTKSQIDMLKKLTPNWHGNLYVTTNIVQNSVDACVADGLTNMSIMANKSYVSESIIAYIHSKGYMYLASQMQDPVMSDFIELSDWGCDIAQTGISNIHALSFT